MDDERELFQSAENASEKIVVDNMPSDENALEKIVEDTTESLTLTIEDYKITENTMIGFSLGGSALIVSMCILGLITIFRRV